LLEQPAGTSTPLARRQPVLFLVPLLQLRHASPAQLSLCIEPRAGHFRLSLCGTADSLPLQLFQLSFLLTHEELLLLSKLRELRGMLGVKA
jgi:hypothetical protein